MKSYICPINYDRQNVNPQPLLFSLENINMVPKRATLFSELGRPHDQAIVRADPIPMKLTMSINAKCAYRNKCRLTEEFTIKFMHASCITLTHTYIIDARSK